MAWNLLTSDPGFGSDREDQRPSTSASTSSSNSGNGISTQKVHGVASGNGHLDPKYHNSPKGHATANYEIFDTRPSAHDQSSRTVEKGKPYASSFLNGNSDVDSQVDIAAVEGTTRSSKESSNPFVTPDGSVKNYPSDNLHVDDDIADQHSRLMDNNEITYEQDHAQPLRPFDGNRRLRRSQVIRKINSGFEILRPGTLNNTRQNNDDAIAVRKDLEGASKRELKKLQKRGRASSRSSYTLET